MTIKELYNWAIAHNVENQPFNIHYNCNDGCYSFSKELTKDNIHVNLLNEVTAIFVDKELDREDPEWNILWTKTIEVKGRQFRVEADFYPDSEEYNYFISSIDDDYCIYQGDWYDSKEEMDKDYDNFIANFSKKLKA